MTFAKAHPAQMIFIITSYRLEAHDYVVVDKGEMLLSVIKCSWNDLQSRTCKMHTGLCLIMLNSISPLSNTLCIPLPLPALRMCWYWMGVVYAGLEHKIFSLNFVSEQSLEK